MHIAGLVHDIGKLAVPRTVLEKPGKLDPDEFAVIRTHTYWTYQILDAIPGSRTINVWASFHHERLDGKGYPFHLRRENLITGARIMAVADAFTAITEDRPYRKGMDDDTARKVIRNMTDSGAFDPKVSDLLFNHFDEVNTVRAMAQTVARQRYEEWMQ